MGGQVRSVAGVRGDIYNFDVDSSLNANSGDRTGVIGSPKLSLVFGPWKQTEVYVQGGLGFHSNDGRGVKTRIEDNSFRSEATILLNAAVGWRFNETWTLSAEILNLLDRRDHDIDYAYESRVRPNAQTQAGPPSTSIPWSRSRLALR